MGLAGGALQKIHASGGRSAGRTNADAVEGHKAVPVGPLALLACSASTAHSKDGHHKHAHTHAGPRPELRPIEPDEEAVDRQRTNGGSLKKQRIEEEAWN